MYNTIHILHHSHCSNKDKLLIKAVNSKEEERKNLPKTKERFLYKHPLLSKRTKCSYKNTLYVMTTFVVKYVQDVPKPKRNINHFIKILFKALFLSVQL